MRNSPIIVSIVCFIAAVFCAVSLRSSNFVTVAIMPAFFCVGFVFFFQGSVKNSYARISVILLYALFFVRMVFIPVYGIFDGYYEGTVSDALSKYCNISVALSSYEYFAACLVLYLTVLKGRNNLYLPKPLRLSGGKAIYLIIILIAFALFVVRGRHLGLFEIGFKSVGGDFVRSGDIEEGGLLKLFINIGITLFFLLLTTQFANRYRLTSARKYVTYSIIIAMFMVSIISGERRTSQIYKGFACIWLLIGLFPIYKKKITSSLLVVAVIVIGGMTLYKQYHAFLYETYFEALSHARSVGMGTGILDAYFYGINTISKNLAFADAAHIRPFNLLYDFARNVFGLNLLVPHDYPLTSQLYNLSLSLGEAQTGYLLSSVGYGYAFFGFYLSPIFTCLNVVIMVVLEKAMRKTNSIELSYIFAFLFMRFGFGFLGSIPPLLNLTTRMLCVYGGIVLIASLFKRPVKQSAQ